MGLEKGMSFNVEKLSEAASEGMSQSHIHDYYEIYYLLEGKRRFIINHTLYDIVPQDLMLIDKTDVHISQPADKEMKYARYLLTFNDTFANDFGRTLDKTLIPRLFEEKRLHLSDTAHNRMNRLLQKAADKLNDTDNYSNHLAKLAVMEILITLSRYRSSSDELIRYNATASVYDERIQEVCRYMFNNYNKPITLESAARIAYMSPNYLSRQFRRATGFCFRDYLNNIRIKMAADMLMEPDMSISDIAGFCGFRDSNYFGDVFRRIMGVSPNKYRKEHYVKRKNNAKRCRDKSAISYKLKKRM